MYIVRFYGLLLRYYLFANLRMLYLHNEYYVLLKVAGAALIEAVKIEYCIKSLSKRKPRYICRLYFCFNLLLGAYRVDNPHLDWM